MLAAPAVPGLPWMAQAPLQATGALNEMCSCCRLMCAEDSKQHTAPMLDHEQHNC